VEGGGRDGGRDGGRGGHRRLVEGARSDEGDVHLQGREGGRKGGRKEIGVC